MKRTLKFFFLALLLTATVSNFPNVLGYKFVVYVPDFFVQGKYFTIRGEGLASNVKVTIKILGHPPDSEEYLLWETKTDRGGSFSIRSKIPMGSQVFIWGKDKLNMIVYYNIREPEPGHVWGESGSTGWFFRTYYLTRPPRPSSGSVSSSDHSGGWFKEEDFERRKGALINFPSPSAEVKIRSKDRHGHNDKYEEENDFTWKMGRDRKRSSK